MTALCMCGCGQAAPIAPCSNATKGWVRGEPRPFCNGHNRRKPDRYLEQECGHDTPCWVWLLTIGSNGYGQAWDPRQRRLRQAHRVIYEEQVGAVPDGLDLDHLCRVRVCVNPDHLEPVTRGENLRRGYAARREMEATS